MCNVAAIVQRFSGLQAVTCLQYDGIVQLRCGSDHWRSSVAVTCHRWNRVFSQAPMPEADLNVQQSDGSALVDTQQESGQSGWQTGKFTRISTMGHQQSETSLQKDDSVLRRRMESFKGLFGASSKSLNAAGRASISGRKEAVEDRTPASRDRADSEIMMTGADNLLAPSSVAGTKKLTIGRSLQKAEAATAAAGSSKVNGDIAAAVPRQSNSSTTPAASASSSKALEQQRLPLQHATTTEGIKGVFQSKVPLPRSQTIGGISFAISTAASAAARHSTDNPYTRSPHTTKGSFMLQQSSADSRLPGVTAASLHVKGPAYGQMLTRRVFGKSNRAGECTSSSILTHIRCCFAGHRPVLKATYAALHFYCHSGYATEYFLLLCLPLASLCSVCCWGIGRAAYCCM